MRDTTLPYPLLSLPGVSLVVPATLRGPGEHGPKPWAWHTAGCLNVPTLQPVSHSRCPPELPTGAQNRGEVGKGLPAWGTWPTQGRHSRVDTCAGPWIAHWSPSLRSPCLPPGAPPLWNERCGPSSGVSLHIVWLPRREKLGPSNLKAGAILPLGPLKWEAQDQPQKHNSHPGLWFGFTGAEAYTILEPLLKKYIKLPIPVLNQKS